MINKTGLVMEINKKSAYIMTPNGEFAEVKITAAAPSIGSTYTGPIYTKYNTFKYVAAAACLIFFTSIGGGAYAYYTPTTSVVVDINPSLELKLNRWNRIIKTIPLNHEGEQLANSLNIKNKDIDTGLTMLLDEAEKESFILTPNGNEEQSISLNVTSSKDVTLSLPKFEEKTDSKKIDVKIDYSKEDISDGIINNGKDSIKQDKSNSDSKVKESNSDADYNDSSTDSKGNTKENPSQQIKDSNNENKKDQDSKETLNNKETNEKVTKPTDDKSSNVKQSDKKKDKSKYK